MRRRHRQAFWEHVVEERPAPEVAARLGVTVNAVFKAKARVPNALMLEWDQNPNAVRDELLKEPLKLESDGTVRLPERPGLGIELDRAAVERYRVG